MKKRILKVWLEAHITKLEDEIISASAAMPENSPRVGAMRHRENAGDPCERNTSFAMCSNPDHWEVREDGEYAALFHLGEVIETLREEFDQIFGDD